MHARAPNGRTLLICNNFTYSKALYTNDVSGYNKVQKDFFLHWIKKKRLCERFTKEKQRMLIYQRKQHFFSQSRCPKNWANENYPKIAIIEKTFGNVDISTKTFSKTFKIAIYLSKKFVISENAFSQSTYTPYGINTLQMALYQRL